MRLLDATTTSCYFRVLCTHRFLLSLFLILTYCLVLADVMMNTFLLVHLDFFFQIAFPDAVYLVDAIEGGKELIEACKPALESEYVTKVIHDCKRDSEVPNPQL